jgi:hypothetical protein
MKNPSDIDQEELAVIVDRVQSILYWEPHKDGGGRLNPDKQWNVGMLDEIAEVLDDSGLVPKRSNDSVL